MQPVGPCQSPAPLFCLKDLSVSYGDEAVLKKLSLQIRPGEQVAIFGPSGAGKTTLLRHLLELYPAQSAFIHQDYALVAQLSVFHNVYGGRLDQNSCLENLRNLVRPKLGTIEKVQAVLANLTLEDRLWDRVGDLSGGQQQRVAVARAIYRRQPVILADEPVAAIDPHQSTAVLTLLKEAAQTIVVALHDVSLGLESFTRAIGLRSGQLVFDLPAVEVSAKKLEQLYQ